MSFDRPYLLLLLAAVPAAAVAYRLLRARPARHAIRYTNVDVLASVASRIGWGKHVPAALLLLALAALLIALGRPERTVAAEVRAATVVMVTDTSGSMFAKDIKPDRLTAAKQAGHALAKKLLPRGCGAVFSFELKGGREAGRRFIEALRVFSHLANVGDAKSLVIHPASTTHYRMSDEDLERAGIGPGTVRLSIGLEDPEDLVEDLARALRAAQK